MSRLDQHTLRTLGFALIIVGFLLLLIPLLYTSVTNCPANGCPPVAPLWYWIGIFILFSGIALVITGIILLVVARRMKPEQGVEGIADLLLTYLVTRVYSTDPLDQWYVEVSHTRTSL